jgi:hypothetical protein
MYNVRGFIDGSFQRAFKVGLQQNRMDIFNRSIEMAEVAHKRYVEKTANPTPGAVRERMSLPPFEEMLQESYLNFLRQPDLHPLVRFRVWVYAPDELRRSVYDRIKEPMEAMATQMGLDPAKAFPEPPGMKAWREEHPVQEQGDPSKRGVVETEQK